MYPIYRSRTKIISPLLGIPIFLCFCVCIVAFGFLLGNAFNDGVSVQNNQLYQLCKKSPNLSYTDYDQLMASQQLFSYSYIQTGVREIFQGYNCEDLKVNNIWELLLKGETVSLTNGHTVVITLNTNPKVGKQKFTFIKVTYSEDELSMTNWELLSIMPA